MTLVRRILLALFVWALALGPGSPLATSNISLFRVQAYADTTVSQTGSNGGYGENGGDVTLENVASGSGDELYLEQDAYGGMGGLGNDVTAPGQGGFASSILNSSVDPSPGLGTSSTSSTSYTNHMSNIEY